MHLAYGYGVDRLWVVNVGDLKNEELPTEFFLDYAWNPDMIPIEKIHDWEKQWVAQQFGDKFATRIAMIISTYGKLQSDRKPELLNRKITLDPEVDITADPSNAVVYEDGCPFSLTDYMEMERVTAQWRKLAEKAETIRAELPDEFQDAYYQLVFYQVKASALMYEIRLAGFKNLLYKEQKRAATNAMAEIADEKFEESTAMADYYNNELADGKWHNWQLQPYLGYGGDYPNSSWQQPETNNVADPDFIWPELVEMDIPPGPEMGIAIDGSDKVWPDASTEAVLPAFSPFQSQPAQYIEVFNRGLEPFEYTIECEEPWIVIEPNQGTVDKEIRSVVTIDWSGAPEGTTEVPITVAGNEGTRVVVQAVIEHPQVDPEELTGFIESNGYVSLEADHYRKKVETRDITWIRLPGIGRTGAGMTPFPVTAARQLPGGDSPHMEYDFHLFSEGEVEIWAYLSPRNNVLYSDGLQYAISIDDDEPQIVNITETLNGIPMNKSWERNTSDNINLTSTKHLVQGAGHHVLKFWMVDPTVVVQKMVIDTGGLKPSYLGPPESWNLDYLDCRNLE
jgi:hypothetical protein